MVEGGLLGVVDDFSSRLEEVYNLTVKRVGEAQEDVCGDVIAMVGLGDGCCAAAGKMSEFHVGEVTGSSHLRV